MVWFDHDWLRDELEASGCMYFRTVLHYDLSLGILNFLYTTHPSDADGRAKPHHTCALPYIPREATGSTCSYVVLHFESLSNVYRLSSNGL